MAIPGITTMSGTNNLRNAANNIPFLAVDKSAPKALCTMY